MASAISNDKVHGIRFVLVLLTLCIQATNTAQEGSRAGLRGH